jgi:hypothetical protein
VPADVRSEVESAVGQDLSGVPVHRGEDSADAAKALQAKAFHTGGEIHLPEKHGSMSSGEGRNILRHELTHVAQFRRSGGTTPNENSPQGQALEEEAKQVAGSLGSGSRPAAPLRPVSVGGSSAPSGSSSPQRLADPALSHARPAAGVGTSGAPGAARPGSSGAGPTIPPFAQQAAIAAEVRQAALSSGLARPSGGGGVSFASPLQDDDGGPHHTGIQRLADDAPPSSADAASPAGSGPASNVTASALAAGASTGASAASPSLDGAGLDELAGRLYDRIRLRLRRELLVDRERAGALQDLR